MVRLVVLVMACALIGWGIHQVQVRHAQARLRKLGGQLQARGIGFADWLVAAGLHEADLRDRRRRDEVQARLEQTAARLLSGG